MTRFNEDFAAAAEQRSRGILSESWAWLRDNGKWWMMPIVAMLLVFGLLVVVGGSVAAPFIYTLF